MWATSKFKPWVPICHFEQSIYTFDSFWILKQKKKQKKVCAFDLVTVLCWVVCQCDIAEAIPTAGWENHSKSFQMGYVSILGIKMKIWQLSLEESELWDIWGKSQGTGGNSILASAAAKTWSCFSLKIWRKILVFPFTANLGMCKWKRER